MSRLLAALNAADGPSNATPVPGPSNARLRAPSAQPRATFDPFESLLKRKRSTSDSDDEEGATHKRPSPDPGSDDDDDDDDDENIRAAPSQLLSQKQEFM